MVPAVSWNYVDLVVHATLNFDHDIFQLLLFGSKYTLYDNLICKLANSPTLGNTGGINLTYFVIMVFLLE